MPMFTDKVTGKTVQARLCNNENKMDIESWAGVNARRGVYYFEDGNSLKANIFMDRYREAQ